ncbi:MAG: hypothetical protein FWF29_04055, partial [Treponema sp.]|nr:hypothetical protein [Treponema sp.]
MTGNITIWLAFAAGLLSFLSPCVLPLLPSYLCVIGGIQMGDLSDKKGKFKPWLVIKTLFFVLGFSAVFITLSIVLSASISLMGSALVWISRISGIIVILLGLNIIFDFLKFLNYEKRFHLSNTPRGAIGAIVTGAAFGAGWTPCVGPVLAGILLLAAQSGGIPKAVTYLIFFSAGLGLPFIAASVFFDVFLKAKNSLNKHLPLIRRISGILLVILGILMITGQFRTLGSLAAQWQQNTAKTGVSAGEPAVPVTPAASPYDTPQPVIDAFRNAQLPVAAKGNKPIDFTVPLANGGTVKLSDLQGKVVFL